MTCALPAVRLPHVSAMRSVSGCIPPYFPMARAIVGGLIFVGVLYWIAFKKEIEALE